MSFANVTLSPAPRVPGEALFSIDVEAHLRKAAGHTFGSPSHYPVELVRAALGREASRVAVRLERRRVRVGDNGRGLDEEEMNTVMALLDASKSEAEKEEAVERVQTPAHHGLLAFFAPAPAEIHLENVFNGKKTTVVWRNGSVLTRSGCGIETGTRVTLVTPGQRDMAREKKILTVYCRWALSEVLLNGDKISGGRRLSRQMATVALSGSGIAAAGTVGVPQSGQLCRIHLLDRQVPYSYITIPPYKGYVFDAAVEYTGGITVELKDYLAGYAFHLYKWLCGKHAGASPTVAERVEELVFLYSRLTGDIRFFDYFSPFVLCGPDAGSAVSVASGVPARFSLARIEKESERGAIFALPRDRKRPRFSSSLRTMLCLTREQADFLINSRSVPIKFLAAGGPREKWFSRLRYFLKRVGKRLLLRFVPVPGEAKRIKSRELEPPERQLLQLLNREISAVVGAETQERGGVEAVMVAARGPFPVIASKLKLENVLIGQTLYWNVRRHHPLVRRALTVIQADPDNIKFLLPLLRP